MKRIMLLMLLATLLAACSKEPVPDRIKGSYNCVARVDTRYQKGGQWRDTSYVSRTNNYVIISKLDDSHVSIQASSKKWGDIEVATAECEDYNYEANVAGLGALTHSGHTYNADVSGTIAYESRALSVSARITNYPNSGGKYILTWYTTID